MGSKGIQFTKSPTSLLQILEEETGSRASTNPTSNHSNTIPTRTPPGADPSTTIIEINLAPDQLRKEGNQISVLIEAKMSLFEEKLEELRSPLGLLPTGTYDKIDPSKLLEIQRQLETLLDNLTNVVNQLNQVEKEGPKVPKNKALESKLRHFIQSFVKAKNKFSSTTERDKLLTQSNTTVAPRKQNIDILQEESMTITDSLKGVDSALEQARDARAQLIEQRQQVTSTFGKFTGLREQLPEVASVLAAIKNKQRKDVVILGGVIAACIMGLFLYWWSISSSDLSGTSLT